MSALESNLKSTRISAGLSQSELARRAGVSRQAYLAIESGKSVPSTEVSLRLARVLGCSVESLFSLPYEEEGTVTAELAPHPQSLPLPSRVQLFNVGGRRFARPLSGRNSTSYTMTPADGIALGEPTDERVSVRLLAPLEEADTLVLAGGDPAIPFLSRDLALTEFPDGAAGGGQQHRAGLFVRGDGARGGVSPVRRGLGAVQRCVGEASGAVPVLGNHICDSGAGVNRGGGQPEGGVGGG